MMYNHAPENYDCPFCRVAKNEYTETYPITRPGDVFLKTEWATAFIAAGTWPNNPGNVLVIPNRHFENIYELPLEYATEVHRLTRATALAMKAVYRCDGISTRQHNEPHGSQDVWHYHVHVFPRYAGDDLYVLSPQRRTTTPEERLPYAQQLRDAGRPEVCMVFEYHGLFNQAHLEPIRRRRAELEGKQEAVLELLLEGTHKAREVARETLARVKRNMHLNYLEEVA